VNSANITQNYQIATINTLAIVALLLAACQYNDSGEWISFGDVRGAIQQLPKRVSACGFAKEDESDIYAAVDFWNHIAGERIFEQYHDGCVNDQLANLIFVKAGESGDRYVAKIFPSLCGNFLCPNQHVQVYNNWWRADPWFRTTSIRHEIGHYLGLGHGFDNGCVMQTGVHAAQDGLCENEMSAFCNHYPQLLACDFD
jgi:hypothetical protein